MRTIWYGSIVDGRPLFARFDVDTDAAAIVAFCERFNLACIAWAECWHGDATDGTGSARYDATSTRRRVVFIEATNRFHAGKVRVIDAFDRARELVENASDDGITIDAGNVVDLIADNMTRLPLGECRALAHKLGFNVYPVTGRPVDGLDTWRAARHGQG